MPKTVEVLVSITHDDKNLDDQTVVNKVRDAIVFADWPPETTIVVS